MDLQNLEDWLVVASGPSSSTVQPSAKQARGHVPAAWQITEVRLRTASELYQ